VPCPAGALRQRGKPVLEHIPLADGEQVTLKRAACGSMSRRQAGSVLAPRRQRMATVYPRPCRRANSLPQRHARVVGAASALPLWSTLPYTAPPPVGCLRPSRREGTARCGHRPLSAHTGSARVPQRWQMDGPQGGRCMHITGEACDWSAACPHCQTTGLVAIGRHPLVVARRVCWACARLIPARCSRLRRPLASL